MVKFFAETVTKTKVKSFVIVARDELQAQRILIDHLIDCGVYGVNLRFFISQVSDDFYKLMLTRSTSLNPESGKHDIQCRNTPKALS